MAIPRTWLFYGSALRFAAGFGVVFGTTAGAVMLAPPLAGAAFGCVSATADSLVVMALIGALEIFLPPTRLGRALAARPFLVTVAVKFAAYAAIIGAVFGGRFGPHVAFALLGEGFAGRFREQIDTAFPAGFVAVAAGAIVFLLVLQRHASQLIGDRVFRHITFGRYHRPRIEERFFLFIDIVGSTAVAERLGPLSVHRYLDRVFRLASDPIDEHDGDVYQYVGDQIVVTWVAAAGRPAARPLACLLAVHASLAAAEAAFLRDFGTVPRLRAALHAGEVVTGEVGGTRRSIVFHGDVLNTTARIEDLTRELGRPYLVSADALARMEGAPAFALEDLGTHALRGRQAGVRVHALAAP